jgi:predicted MPP superfamily phosphohydrolase
LDSIKPQANALANSDILIGVSHAPYLRVLEAMGSAGVSIIFAGHTHGGQVCLPGIGALTTNCDLPNKYAKGISAWRFAGRDVLLNVVAGLGHSIFAPVRFFCRPEVRLLTLIAKD